ncbi:L-ribulose-5-phosphate 3-epimerase [Vagococcus sp. BWB3-3]|uniref:L-ribulose-5-phosphate 3-epimerase n=1 Tax=Vagococcus allomyrinae TaxID=2794353 RepID=A0A940P9H7_9ENTE|nr:L-ribulose-5-phosphate 3-epimerase [Vagococcus allomyrinae]MBP1043505.1 L-ribulose-5-phosphate 3-epimerase [Vagococcus allomyrinae]
MTTIGIYEKALPKDLSWQQRLELAHSLGFDFVEMSIDETDERLARLDWTSAERLAVVQGIHQTGVKIMSICLSGHRRFPFGSKDPLKRQKALEMTRKAVDLAADLGVRTVQLAGYDVYYEEKTVASRNFFIENLKAAVGIAAAKGITLAIEIMDDPFINSISKFLAIKEQVPSPWLQVYPDLGNLSAWPENDIGLELEKGIECISNVHLKDTLAVKGDFPGKFKGVPFGEGCVDFKGCLATLSRLNYSGAFLIEMWSETSKQPEEEIKTAQDYLLPLLKEAGYDV